MLYDEYKLSKEMALLISGYGELMQEEPISRESINIREQIVLPLLVIQQYAMQKIDQNAPSKEIWEKMVKRSLYGNINASRNSAWYLLNLLQTIWNSCNIKLVNVVLLIFGY